MPKRIRPARHYQRRDDPVRALMKLHKPKIRRDLREALGHLGDLVPNHVERLVADGRWREIVGAIDLPHFREVLRKPYARIATAYQDGAAHGVRKINAVFSRARRRLRFRKAADVFNFDLYTPEVQAALREAQDDLIRQLEQDARDTIEQIVTSGAMEGLGAADIVADIRSFIGLTDTQAQAVLNYRGMLETLDSTALQRQLRNSTMDDLVRAAIDSGSFLEADVIDQMVSDYTENYLDYRASTIAQTESVRAVNSGLHEAYSQAISRGALPDDAVKREWQLGDSPCPICESIPDNNPDGVGVDEDFDSDEGPVDDPPVHPNCMCSVDYVTDISKVPEEEDDSGSYDTAASAADEYL